MDDINGISPRTNVALIIGRQTTLTNPEAREDQSRPIYGHADLTCGQGEPSWSSSAAWGRALQASKIPLEYLDRTMTCSSDVSRPSPLAGLPRESEKSYGLNTLRPRIELPVSVLNRHAKAYQQNVFPIWPSCGEIWARRFRPRLSPRGG